MRGLHWTVASWAFMGLIDIPVLVLFDPLGGWRWEPRNGIHDQTIVSIYQAVGLCSLRALRRPLEHASFLWFVVWSSLAHAVAHPVHVGHLAGDVWIIAGGLGLAVPLRRAQADRRSEKAQCRLSPDHRLGKTG